MRSESESESEIVFVEVQSILVITHFARSHWPIRFALWRGTTTSLLSCRMSDETDRIESAVFRAASPVEVETATVQIDTDRYRVQYSKPQDRLQ